MVKYAPCAMEEFGNGDRLELAAFTIRVTVGCANPVAASSPKVKTIAKKVFTCVFFLSRRLQVYHHSTPVGGGARAPPSLPRRGPVLRVMEPLGASRFPKCDSIHYTNVVWIYLDYHRDRKSTRLNSSHLVISYAV